MFEYKVIKEIENNPEHTQRTLADKLGVSLGKVNYVLTGLIEKGLIRAKKLKNEPENIRWNYLLTRKGIQEKVELTRNYLKRREEEFELLRQEIEELKNEVNKDTKE
ncbi:MAG TPA: MarR family EPS-associated transcriptional regulator [Chitinispirillaceae bacterium]|nr:MarR family EPS-associated transcriptional regulator [Chitinispirillaceae bacterium]